MTYENLGEAWAEAEKVAKSVHLSKIGEGKYVAQLNRERCICNRCSVERKGVSPAAALYEAIGEMRRQPIHETQQKRKEQ